jgi:hypothetical protein
MITRGRIGRETSGKCKELFNFLNGQAYFLTLGAIQIIRDTFLAYFRPPSPMCHLVTQAM